MKTMKQAGDHLTPDCLSYLLLSNHDCMSLLNFKPN